MAHFIAIILATFALIGSLTAGTIPSTRRSYDHQHDDDAPNQPSLATRQALPIEQNSEYWLKKAQDFVTEKRNHQTNVKRAKNIIMFLGDGLSAVTISATRPYVHGEETELSFERFPAVGQAKTYCVDVQVADSACTATAYLGGVKANYGTVGLTAAVELGNCTQQLDAANHVRSIAAWAQAAGMWTGFVTSSTVASASPAALYAHSAHRYWDNDAKLRKACADERAEDIASQLVNGDVGAAMRVILGGGRSDFRGVEAEDEEVGRGLREDGRNLIAEWVEKKRGTRAEYVWNATHLRNIDSANVDYLLGLFEPTDLKYHSQVRSEQSQDREPTLTELTLKAIEILRRSPEGFFLFVENGRIDDAHHQSLARLALDETAELSNAVEAARKALHEEDSLIVVTADHSHTMSYNGYPYRGNNINGVVSNAADDKLPYMTLSYANGPGFDAHWIPGTGRLNMTGVDTTVPNYLHPATVPMFAETHAGDDVLVYASGPWSHLFNGNYEQHVLPHLMAHAACLNGACK